MQRVVIKPFSIPAPLASPHTSPPFFSNFRCSFSTSTEFTFAARMCTDG